MSGYFFLNKDGKWVVARVRPEDIRLLWSRGWSTRATAEAIDWLVFYLEGIAGCSEWEWRQIPDVVSRRWLIEDEFPVGSDAPDAAGLFADCEPHAASDSCIASRPHGSPLGRADGGEPPASAAD